MATTPLFEFAFNFTVGIEGGYSNNPKDPGGETKFGISKRFHPYLDIKSLTIEQAHDIYLREYWNLAGCESVADGRAAVLLFDIAVNEGVSAARSWFSAANSQPSGDLFDQLLSYRLTHYASENAVQWEEFGRGWCNRAAKCLALPVVAV